MLRALLKLALVGGVVTLGGIATSPDLYAASGGALLVLPFAVARVDRKRAESQPAHTLEMMPLPTPRESPDDPEGLTVRAPMSSEEAYEMHARYAPSFDQQVAIARYDAQRREPLPQDPDPVSFDQGRYAAALQYVDAFDAQLTRQRRTAAYEVAPPRRMARGSVTPQQYRAGDKAASFATSPTDWEDHTIVGVPPVKARG